MGRRRKPRLVPSVTITGIADRGKGVGRDEEGRVIFMEDVAPGDVVDALVFKKKKGYFLGAVQHFHTYSADRVSPFCQHFDLCGGCKWQHLSYEAQIAHKQIVVENALKRIGKVEAEEFLPILSAPRNTFYRNKLEFTFSSKRWLTREEIRQGVSNRENVFGFHRAGAFDKVIDIKKCWLQPEPSNKIRNSVKAIALEQQLPFFDIKANEGFLRQLIVRTTTLGETLLVFGFYQDDQKRISTFLDAVREQNPEITTICYCINPKVNDYMMDLEMRTYFGKGYVEEALGHVRFFIGPKSFFQTNTEQAVALYDTVAEFANLQGTENVYDLYTGLGSIALYLAQKCRQIVGIEEIAAAIEDAKKNARLNQIDNAVFYAGDVKDILTPDFTVKHGKPDLIITDPPRAGMHAKVVKMLLEAAAPRLIYVSCNPATQARDLQILSEKYRLKKVRPVDMFPHTHHIESVALLELK